VEEQNTFDKGSCSVGDEKPKKSRLQEAKAAGQSDRRVRALQGPYQRWDSSTRK